MTVDIRKAKRGPGVVPPKGDDITPEKKMAKAPQMDKEEVKLNADMFGEDAVIAGYLEYLAESNITEEDIKNVLNALLTSGNVSWKFDLFESIPVELQIRPSWVNDCILEYVDGMTRDNEKVSMVRYNNLIAVSNLAGSLVRYGNETYVIETEKDLELARTRVQKLPYVIQNALVNKLAVFDRTIAVATSDWAIRNFIKPQKEKSE